MNYSDFRQMVMNRPFFSAKDLAGVVPLDKTLKLQLSQWTKKGKIIRLKKGLYTLNEMDRQADLSSYMLANELYSPSYVSLEFALSHYQLIPEAVNMFTSVTTNKTNEFKNQYGVFTYRSIKKDLFFGFKQYRSPDGHNFFLGTPEKCVLDFIYFNISVNVKDIKQELSENYRFQNWDLLDPGVLKDFSSRMNEKKIINFLPALTELIREGR